MVGSKGNHFHPALDGILKMDFLVLALTTNADAFLFPIYKKDFILSGLSNPQIQANLISQI